MPEPIRIASAAIDIARRGSSSEFQEALADVVWSILERGYRVTLWSSDPEDDLSTEDYQHPNLSYEKSSTPYDETQSPSNPELITPTTLWYTEVAEIHEHLRDLKIPFVYTESRDSINGGSRIPSLRELAFLLNPTATLLGGISERIADLRAAKRDGALLVGIGGPPHSGYQQFTIDLQHRLQSHGLGIVDLLNFNPVLVHSETESQPADPDGQWVGTAAKQWIQEQILVPLRAGQRVFLERMPEFIPREFGAHLPLFLSEESTILLLAETCFAPEVAACLDLAILLEVSPMETTRRLYEISSGEPFDAKFITQYLEREGKIYSEYHSQLDVEQGVDIRIDANNAKAFHLRAGL